MKHLFFATATLFLLASCSQPFKKTEQGMEYKIISDGKGKQLADGNFFEFTFDQGYKGPNKDTVLMGGKDFPSQIIVLDSINIPPLYYKIFKQLRKGDSVILRQLTDTIMKQQMGRGQLPPFIKKGAYIVSHFKILNIFDTQAAADSAKNASMLIAHAKDSAKALEQIKKDDKTINDYLAKNKIQTVKAPMGTYVQIINPGEGNALDTATVVKVKYTGKTMAEGKTFDSNIDPSFNHTDPIAVYLGAPAGSQVIKGWTDGISMLKKGGKANLYIPSSLAYGPQAMADKIKANSILIFEVEIVDAVPAAQARAEAEVEKKKMMAENKRRMDSMQRAQKDTSMRK